MSKTASKDLEKTANSHEGSVKNVAKAGKAEPKVYRNEDDPDDYSGIAELYEAEQRARQSGYEIDEAEHTRKFTKIVMKENKLVFDALAKL